MVGRVPAVVRRSFAEFLAIPTALFSGFVALAAGMIAIDKTDLAVTRGARETITLVSFADADAEATGVLLDTNCDQPDRSHGNHVLGAPACRTAVGDDV